MVSIQVTDGNCGKASYRKKHVLISVNEFEMISLEIRKRICFLVFRACLSSNEWLFEYI